jgi:hypothetical protein
MMGSKGPGILYVGKGIGGAMIPYFKPDKGMPPSLYLYFIPCIAVSYYSVPSHHLIPRKFGVDTAGLLARSATPFIDKAWGDFQSSSSYFAQTSDPASHYGLLLLL